MGGQWYDLTLDPATRLWTAVITAPGSSVHQPGGYYNLTVEAANETGSTATADGSTIPGLRLTVRERVKPVLTVVSPPPGYVTDNMMPVVIDVTDDDSGADMDTFILTVDGVVVPAGYTDIPGGYRAAWTPSEPHSDGAHSITAQVTDYDGNTGETESTFTVDTIPPVLLILSGHIIVDTAAIEITGYTTDVSQPVTVKVVCGEYADTPGVGPDGRFSTTVPLTEGDNTVTVTATDAAGLETVESFTVIRLVTDRTQADVDRLKHLLSAGWAKMSEPDRAWYMDTVCRGAYNAEDFNRVSRAMAYLNERYRARGYLPKFMPQGIVWTENDIPKPEQTDAYLTNVDAFRHLVPLDDPPPTPEDMNGFTFSEANDIESILVKADAVIPNIALSAWHCGEIMAGEF